MSLLQKVAKIQEQILAEDHPDQLASQHALAVFYWDLGRRSTSLQMMKHVVSICQRVLDEHHMDRMLGLPLGGSGGPD